MNSDDENGENGDKSSLKTLLISEFGADVSLYDIIGASRDASPGYCIFTLLLINSLNYFLIRLLT